MNNSKVTIRLGLEYKGDDGKITAIDKKISMTEMELSMIKPEQFIAGEYAGLYVKLEKHVDKLETRP